MLDSIYAIMFSTAERICMYKIEFYETVDGSSDIYDLLEALRKKAPYVKDARIQFGQISRCIELLQQNGTNLPIDIVKHIDNEIWELRPGKNRVFFFFYANETFVLLHHYRKKSQKTPVRQIIKAKNEMNDYISRKGDA